MRGSSGTIFKKSALMSIKLEKESVLSQDHADFYGIVKYRERGVRSTRYLSEVLSFRKKVNRHKGRETGGGASVLNQLKPHKSAFCVRDLQFGMFFLKLE